VIPFPERSRREHGVARFDFAQRAGITYLFITTEPEMLLKENTHAERRDSGLFERPA